MRVIRKDEPEKVDRSSAPIFYGGKVVGQTLVGPDTNKYYNFTVVSFEKGAKNHFHSHTSDQVLYVLEGEGIVADENGEVVIKQGDTAHIPAGEKHWHGATDHSAFSHISLQTADSTTTVYD